MKRTGGGAMTLAEGRGNLVLGGEGINHVFCCDCQACDARPIGQTSTISLGCGFYFSFCSSWYLQVCSRVFQRNLGMNDKIAPLSYTGELEIYALCILYLIYK
ncbi:hypothetical protein chiPu_0007455 [Chiloscyllium punctatum]|uniref:Uncharacterized protein n=1 Tax=Chiloscyllium punctatum TaxID=137246 RepID=A0A401SF42_CHIPU|nr:hypothetical protein [Chiloscyllium punctatum]